MYEPIKRKKFNLKKIILKSFLGIFIGGLVGTTYAFFTYNKTGINNKLIAGDIYMRYKETSAINLSGAMPSATYPTEASGNYFEFQIIGKNTSNRDITYNVKLAYGDAHGTRTTRIDDEYILFKLVEVVNGVEQPEPLVEDESFDTIPEATLYTETIQGGGASAAESTRTFRVYARISDEVIIGNLNQTYTESEWNNLYASVKINVDGGLVVTPTPTPSSNAVYVVSSTYMYIGSNILEGVNQRTGVNGPSQAMADWQDIIGTPGATRPFYLKHILNANDEIEESYVEFVITNELKEQLKTQYCNTDYEEEEDIPACETKYDNLVNGTYSLRGLDTYDLNWNCKPEYDDGNGNCVSPYYSQNVDEIKTAFNYDTQPSICGDPASSSHFYCNLSGLDANADSGGNVAAIDHFTHFCDVYAVGYSRCV